MARATAVPHAQRPPDAHHHVLIALQAEKEGENTPPGLLGFACPCGELFTVNGRPSHLYRPGQDGAKRNKSHLRRVVAYSAMRKVINEATEAVQEAREAKGEAVSAEHEAA
jgi:hypothetical protein